MMGWLYDPSHSPHIGAWSFLLGIVGFALTVVGLWFTYRQAKQAVTAARASTAAVQNFKFRLNEYSAARDLSEAIYAMQSVKQHVEGNDWRLVGRSYEDARRSIMRIKVGGARAIESDVNGISGKIDTAVEEMADICDVVSAALFQKGEFPEQAKMLSVIRQHLDTLETAKSVLEKEL